jgi:hypothetical protein
MDRRRCRVIELRATLVDFQPVDGNRGWRLDTEANAIPLNFEHGDQDAAVDHDRFSDTPREYQHAISSPEIRKTGSPGGACSSKRRAIKAISMPELEMG